MVTWLIAVRLRNNSETKNGSIATVFNETDLRNIFTLLFFNLIGIVLSDCKAAVFICQPIKHPPLIEASRCFLPEL